MKERASAKEKPTQWEMFSGVAEERDSTITLFMEWYLEGCKAIDALIDRIRQEGLAKLKTGDFQPPLENLARWVFVEMIDGLENVFFCASDKFKLSMYPEIRFRYERKLCTLTKAIRECLPDNQQAQQLAAAIDRLAFEVTDALSRGVEQYLNGKGKPQPNDLLSDTRHGALWDNVENAIIALSTAQGETNADICAAVRAEVRAEVRVLKNKSDAKETRRKQRERAAQWLKGERAAGHKNEVGHDMTTTDAARHFYKEITDEKSKGGYKNTNALLTALNKQAAALEIAQFIDSTRGRPRKQ